MGMALAALGASVTLTDLPIALPLLHHNVGANFGKEAGQVVQLRADDTRADHADAGVDAVTPRVQPLVWGEDHEDVPPFTVVVASDVVYDRYVAVYGHRLPCYDCS